MTGRSMTEYKLPDDETLEPSLERLHLYVKRTRGEEIRDSLEIYEQRVYWSNLRAPETDTSEIIEELLISFEDIKAQLHEEAGRPNWEKRTVKKLFLIGWLEDNLWRRGNEKKQIVYPLEKHRKDLDFRIVGQFLYGETTEFSIEGSINYGKKYFGQPQPRSIFNRKKCRFSNTDLFVFVTPDLRYFYYGDSPPTEKVFEDVFEPIESEIMSVKCMQCTMHTIKFLQTNEAHHHASIANFDSWQNLLHCTIKQGGILSSKKLFREQVRELCHDAAQDKTTFTDDIKKILFQIATQTGIGGLDAKQRGLLNVKAQDSPKIQLAIKLAQMQFRELKKLTERSVTPLSIFDNLVKSGVDRLEAVLRAALPLISADTLVPISRSALAVGGMKFSDLMPHRQIVYKLGDPFPGFAILTPSNIKYRSVLMIKAQSGDVVVLTDNVRLKPTRRQKDEEFLFSPEITSDDKGNCFLFILLTGTTLDFGLLEDVISLEKFVQIIAQINIEKGDIVDCIYMTIL